LQYCLGRWLGTYKKQLVHCYVDEIFHGGTTTTSRLEGAHHVLKCWIGKPTKDLTGVWEAVQLAINHQLGEIRQYRGYCWSSNPIRLRNEFFSALPQYITPTGQHKLWQQWQFYKNEETRVQNGQSSTICTGTFFRSIGVPCWHMIKERLAAGGRIQPMDFHPHWHWFRPPPGSAPVVLPLPILDPETRQYRRTQEAERRLQARQYARARTAATGRILSQYKQQQSVLRHCSACTEFGHDKATCRGCRSTNHIRNACPHVSYQRRQATNDTTHQRNVEAHRRYTTSQVQQQSPMLGLGTPGSSSQMDMQYGQIPTHFGLSQASQYAPSPLSTRPSTHVPKCLYSGLTTSLLPSPKSTATRSMD
jgi:hypothetical protein